MVKELSGKTRIKKGEQETVCISARTEHCNKKSPQQEHLWIFISHDTRINVAVRRSIHPSIHHQRCLNSSHKQGYRLSPVVGLSVLDGPERNKKTRIMDRYKTT